jgi:prepilin-type N-terminal cleavage/methylation domain-containing protein
MSPIPTRPDVRGHGGRRHFLERFLTSSTLESAGPAAPGDPVMTRRLSTSLPADRNARRRAGFSLIELLIVITIIGILVSLLLVGVQAAVSRARVAQVVAEMKNFEQAIAQFQKELGIHPPSFIKIHESATLWATSGDTDTRSSRAILKQLWPNFDFTTMGDATASPAPVSSCNPTAGNNALDLNGDGDENDTLVLCGSECLVFFLGGLQKKDSPTMPLTSASLTGFSKVPTGPLARISSGGSSYGPYYEGFDSKRLVDLDSDGMPEYLDALPGQSRPLQYLSSYEGAGYRPYGRDGIHGNADDELLTNSMLWIYTRTKGSNTAAPGEPYNPKTFQIISPGFDREYGKGGIVDAENGVSDMTTAAPLHLPAGNTNIINTPNTTVTRVQPDTLYERDNIVNFLPAELH